MGCVWTSCIEGCMDQMESSLIALRRRISTFADGVLRQKDINRSGRAAKLFGRVNSASERFWNSKAYFPAVIGAAALFLFTGNEKAGMLAMFALIVFMHFSCSDLLAGVLPEVLILLLGTKYFNDLGSLVSLWWMIPVLAVSYAYNVIHWGRGSGKRGSFGSLKAVAVATLVGGIGCISVKEYFSVLTLLYGVGLGAGMLVSAYLFNISLSRKRNYVLSDRFAAILYSVGIFAGLIILNYYIVHFSWVINGRSLILYIQYRNYLTTLLLVAMPIPFKFFKKSKLNFAALAFMYASMLMTGSRSGLVFGTIEVSMCVFLTIYRYRKLTRRAITKYLLFFAVAACGIYALGNTVLSSRLVDGQLFPASDSRVFFWKRAVLDFLNYPIAGIGLGNTKNSSIFIGVNGSMVWYHNYFAQILGSMGLIGAVAYGWLLRDRFVLSKQLLSKGESMLVMAYIGMFMVSMTNPGEFCPYPNEFLMVLLFEVAKAITVPQTEKESPRIAVVPSSKKSANTLYMSEYSGAKGASSMFNGTGALAVKSIHTEEPAKRNGNSS